MYRQNCHNVDFINRFIDSVTIRPFLEDLRRVKRAAEQFPLVPRVIQHEQSSTEAA